MLGRNTDGRTGPPAGSGRRWIVQGDPTEGALLVAARKAGLASEALSARFKRVTDDNVLGRTPAAQSGGLALPLLTTQVLWINLVTDGAPALALRIDPAAADVHRAFNGLFVRRHVRRRTQPGLAPGVRHRARSDRAS